MATTVRSPLIGTLNIKQRETLLRYAKKFAENCQQDIGTFRSLLEFRDRAYQMQLDQSRDKYAEIKKVLGGTAKRQVKNIDVPIVLPQIESAVAYQTGVYLSSYPIFGVVSTPKNINQALQMETVIGHHSIEYGWARELIKVFRNGFKHNFGPTFVHWNRRMVPKVTTSTDAHTAGMAQITQDKVGGNCIKALDPYNCFFSMQVMPARYHDEGEAFGWNELMPRMTFKRFVQGLDASKTTNLREAFECTYASVGSSADSAMDYYVPKINPSLNITNSLNGQQNWMVWAGLEVGSGGQRINYRDNYLITRFVCRALPSDFGKEGGTPTMYYCIIVNWKYVIYVEEIVAAHDFLPVFILQPNEDDLGFQTQSMLDTSLPFQDMSTALWNISLESKRRLVFDRLVYNERFINKADIDPASAIARIPLRNASQFKGDDIGKALFQIPFREDNSNNNIQMSEMISQMADVAAGQNKVDRGQFQKGNKTKTEFVTTMDNSSARQQLTSLTIEGQYMTPVKTAIKANILVNQEAGSYTNRNERDMVDVDPVKLREANLEFKLTDGMLPMAKLLNPELMTVFMQYAQTMPVAMTEYDVLGMFMYWLKLQGAYWVDDFKRDAEAQKGFLDMFAKTSVASNMQPPQPQPAGAAA